MFAYDDGALANLALVMLRHLDSVAIRPVHDIEVNLSEVVSS